MRISSKAFEPGAAIPKQYTLDGQNISPPLRIEDVPQAVVAVSPIVAGRAVKGPAAKMMVEMGQEASAATVAGHYGELIDGFVYDERDATLAVGDGLALLCVDTIMNNPADRERLARGVLDFALALMD